MTTLAAQAVVDDDGSKTTGTIWNAAFQAAFEAKIQDALTALDVVDAARVTGVSIITTTGTSTALAIPTGSGDLVTVHNNATLHTVQGMAAGVDGQRWTHLSKGAGQVDFAHLHASGTALGKLHLFATTGLTSLAAGSGVAVFQYDATVTQWRLVSHEQGAWIMPAFVAGDYTSPTGSWTVGAGDVTAAAYLLRGRTLHLRFYLVTTDVTGTPVSLNRVIPGGFTAAANDPATLTRATDAAQVVGLAQATGTAILFYATVAGGGWTAGANRAIECAKTIEVT